mmetsp:Transcript_46034/g.127868  ORF Transcript_46034/g.127868 Transcript_46034/m.127868 type:complete len:540 (+) Transcript_46034:55-1674(+)
MHFGIEAKGQLSLMNVAVLVWDAYNEVGQFLGQADAGDAEGGLLLLDPTIPEVSIAGASARFSELTGYTIEDLLAANCEMLLRELPGTLISKSARTNMTNYCQVCIRPDVAHVGEVHAVLPCARKDGSVFTSFISLRRCVVRGRVFVLRADFFVDEGPYGRLSQAQNSEMKEKARSLLVRECGRLERALCAVGGGAAANVPGGALSAFEPGFMFFGARLSEHALVCNAGATAERREAEDLGHGCLVFGDKPTMPSPEGLCFAVRVDKVTNAFSGLPFLGFTRRRPSADDTNLYPSVSKCLAQSVLIGGASDEAFARDKLSHFVMGFKKPPQDEISSWPKAPLAAPNNRRSPAHLHAGDHLECRYTWEGRLQLWRNGEKISDYDLERPIDREAEYYAVVDVTFAASSLTLVPRGPTVVTSPAEAEKCCKAQMPTISELSTQDADDSSSISATTVLSSEEGGNDDASVASFIPVAPNSAEREKGLCHKVEDETLSARYRVLVAEKSVPTGMPPRRMTVLAAGTLIACAVIAGLFAGKRSRK